MTNIKRPRKKMLVVQNLYNQVTEREWCINGERRIYMSKQNFKKSVSNKVIKCLKGTVHLKMKALSSFTYPHLLSNNIELH